MKKPYLAPALAAALALMAGAADGAPDPANEPSNAPPPPAPVDPPIDRDDERSVPDYDGREDPTTAGDVLIWVPRILVSPLYLVSEFVVRRPLGALVTWAEKNHVPERVVDALTFGEDRQGGIVPTGLIDFGFRPSVGLYFFYNRWIPHNDLRIPHNDLRIRGAVGIGDLKWLSLSIRNRYVIADDERIAIGGLFLRRPDWVFHGLGPESPDTEYRFSATTLQGDLTYEKRLWRRSNLSTLVGVRSTTFDPDEFCCDDDSVATGVRLGDLAEPPGMADGYTLLRTGLEFDLDSRHLREPLVSREYSDFKPPPGSGVRLDLRAEYDAGLGRYRPFTNAPLERYEFVKYGASLTGFWDVNGDQRVLSLSGIVDFADPVREDGQIPFSEQVSLGGARPMRGFLTGRLLDRSAAVGRFIYTWPVWVWLDGALGYELGNVFGEHLSGFELDKLRSSFGFGLRSNTSEDHLFELLLAFGTETIGDGMAVENVRFVLGATSGF
jgi:hypothetical protein